MTFLDIINKPSPKKTFKNIEDRDEFIRKLSKRVIITRRPISMEEIRDILIKEYGIYRNKSVINKIVNKKKYNDKKE